MLKLILIFFIFSNFIFGKNLEMDLFAKNAILINARTGAILYEKNADEKVYPASITKIATALYALSSKKDLDEMMVPSFESLRMAEDPKKNYPSYFLHHDATTMNLKVGQSISLRSLLYGLMLISGNDCANVIAESTSKSIPKFVKELNDYLKKIGCKNTNFSNPHGYHYPDHYTTARDMAMIAQQAMLIPEFRKIVSSLSYRVPELRREIKQYSKLQKKGKYYYPYCIGIKTGFHSLAKYNLVAAAQFEKRELIAVLMGGEKSKYRYIDAKKLFETAFSEKIQSRLIMSKEKRIEAKVQGGKDMVAYLKDDFFYQFYPSEEQSIKTFIYWDNFQLPIQKDAKVGNILLIAPNGTILDSAPLFSQNKVRRTFGSYCKSILKKIF